MTIKTTLLPTNKAAFVQEHCAEYGCTLVEIGVSGNNTAKQAKERLKIWQAKQ